MTRHRRSFPLGTLRTLLQPGTKAQPWTGTSHALAAARSRATIRAVYAFNLFTAATLLRDWARFQEPLALDALWPVRFLTPANLAVGATTITLLHVASALWATVDPARRMARLLAAGAALLSFALQNSFGKISHGYHALLWVLVVLVFLPSSAPPESPHERRVHDQRTLRIVWTAMMVVGLFYSMSGALKLYATARQLLAGQSGFLSLDAAARHIAHVWMISGKPSLFGGLILDHPILGVPAHYLSVYLELGCLWAAFRPATHVLWGAGLILMHLGIGVTMNIWAVHNIALLGLLYVGSPFHRPGLAFAARLRALPAVDLLMDND